MNIFVPGVLLGIRASEPRIELSCSTQNRYTHGKFLMFFNREAAQEFLGFVLDHGNSLPHLQIYLSQSQAGLIKPILNQRSQHGMCYDRWKLIGSLKRSDGIVMCTLPKIINLPILTAETVFVFLARA